MKTREPTKQGDLKQIVHGLLKYVESLGSDKETGVLLDIGAVLLGTLRRYGCKFDGMLDMGQYIRENFGADKVPVTAIPISQRQRDLLVRALADWRSDFEQGVGDAEGRAGDLAALDGIRDQLD